MVTQLTPRASGPTPAQSHQSAPQLVNDCREMGTLQKIWGWERCYEPIIHEAKLRAACEQRHAAISLRRTQKAALSYHPLHHRPLQAEKYRQPLIDRAETMLGSSGF
jgi:hypothetical protein